MSPDLFRQLSSPVAAKSVEDTAFYRYGRLLSRNDVGFDVKTFSLEPEAFHARVLKRQIMIVDSAQNCARAVEEMLDRQSLRAAPLNNGKLHVALTDAADNFLNVAREALQLNFGQIELRALP